MTKARREFSDIIKYGILAGAAGGLAEIAWVSVYAALTGGDAAVLARGVTTAAGISALLPEAPVTLGIAVHMALAVVLGVAVAMVWQSARGLGTGGKYVMAISMLAAVWAVNFFIVLPALSPDFVHLVPYAVSLTSKLLFGVAVAETLRRSVSASEAVLQPQQR